MKKEISVEYIDSMGSDQRVCNVARTSFAKWNDESVELNQKDIGLLNYLASGVPATERDDYEALYKASTHWAPFAHCQLTIRMCIPVFLARQLVKHVVGLTWSEESRRYISSEVDYWIPSVIHAVPEGSIKQGSGLVHKNSEVLRKSMELRTNQAIDNYYELLKQGVAPEEARMTLPLNAMVNVVWTGSLLAFIRVVKQRKSSHAQLAAQEFATQLEEIIQEHFPESLKAYQRSFE